MSVDMLLDGSHKKTEREHWDYVRACERRVKAGREAISTRKSAARIISKHYKGQPFVDAL